MCKYNEDIACLLENRTNDSGHSVVKVPGEEAYCHFYRGDGVGNCGRQGVAIALSEAAQVALLAWMKISPRLAGAYMKGVIMNRIAMSVYAPTLDAEEDAKDSFYNDIQHAIDSVPVGDMLIVPVDRKDPVQWTRQHGTSWKSLLWVRGVLTATAW